MSTHAEEPEEQGREPISVVIADDDASVRTDFRRLLELEPDIRVVAVAHDGLDALAQVAATTPAVAVMDVRMPRLDGIEATARIRQDVSPSTAVLVVTTFDLDDYVLGALRAGAAGFLLKHQAPDELADAIRTVAAGNSIVAPRATRRLIEELVVPAVGSHHGAALTGREMTILRHVTRGLSNDEIAGAEYVSVPTVKTHIRHLLAKIGATNRTQAVIWAYEHGIVHPRRPG